MKLPLPTKQKIEELNKENPAAFTAWKRLCEARECMHCKQKFPDGILKPISGAMRPLIDFVRPEYALHMQTTHGIEPRMLLSMIISLISPKPHARQS